MNGQSLNHKDGKIVMANFLNAKGVIFDVLAHIVVDAPSKVKPSGTSRSCAR